MKIKFSEHAEITLKKRKIPKSRVLQVIQKPHAENISFRGRKLSRRVFNNKVLEVVTVTEENVIIVITQYYLEAENEIQIRRKN